MSLVARVSQVDGGHALYGNVVCSGGTGDRAVVPEPSQSFLFAGFSLQAMRVHMNQTASSATAAWG